MPLALVVEHKQDDSEEETVCCAEGETRNEEPVNEGVLRGAPLRIRRPISEVSTAWTQPPMNDCLGRNKQARSDVLEPVDRKRRASRPFHDKPAGHRNSVDGKQGQQMDDPSHVVVAVQDRGMPLSSHDQPKTFTALAITSAMVVTATRLCTAIIPFAQRASGMVSVGENAIALVRLT